MKEKTLESIIPTLAALGQVCRLAFSSGSPSATIETAVPIQNNYYRESPSQGIVLVHCKTYDGNTSADLANDQAGHKNCRPALGAVGLRRHGNAGLFNRLKGKKHSC